MSVFTTMGITTDAGSETTSKIAVGTAGQIFTSNGTSSLPEFKGNLSVTNGTTYFDGTTLATTAVGTANQVLTSNGASAPTYQAGPAYRLIQTQEFSTKSTVDFVGLAGIPHIMVALREISTGTSGRVPVMLFSTDNGSSFLTANYASAANSFGTTISTTTFTNSTSTSSILLTQNTLSTVSGKRASGNILIDLFSYTTVKNIYGTVHQSLNAGDGCAVNYIYASLINSTACNAIRFQLDDGTSTFSGRISLYRLVT